MFSQEDHILVAVSGGKDSLTLWDILNKLGYHVDGLYIGLGIDEGIHYSDESLCMATHFAQYRNLHLVAVDVPSQYGESIPQMAQRTQRGRKKTCSVCGLSKLHIINRIAREGDYDILSTGHNLDDVSATLFGITINWLEDYLLKIIPVLDTVPGLTRKVKPLVRFSEREMAAYTLIQGIEYIQLECPFSINASSIQYKTILNQLEYNSPGTKQYF